MGKWISFTLVLGMIGMVLFHVDRKSAHALEEQDLLTMVTIMQGENIDINGWSLYAREKIATKQLRDVKQLASQMQQHYHEWTWEITTTEDKWEASATIERYPGITENIVLLSSNRKRHPQTYISYKATGENVTSKTEQFIKEDINRLKLDIFRGNTTFFSCIKGQFNDKMNTSLPNTVNGLLKKFNAKQTETSLEEGFISTSAYTPVLENGLEVNGEKINLQIGIRNNRVDATTTIVVGTPLITIEY